MKPQPSMEQLLERSVHQARSKRLALAESDLSEWLAAIPEPENNMSTAIQRTEPEHQLARAAPVDSLGEWEAMREQATALVSSGFLPRAVNTPEKAMAIIQTGKELGLGPMQALRSIHIIEGKPTMSADLIAGLALAKLPGSVLRVSESSDKQCVIEAGRAGQKLTTFTYTMADAQRAGLAGKDNWKKHPRAMLRARAITEAARAIFPDTCVGLYDPDELGAVTGPSGEIIQVPHITEVRSADSPHTPIDEEPDAGQSDDAASFMARMTETLEKLKSDVAYCKTWEELQSLRGKCGSKSVQSPLLKQMQDYGPERRIISGAQFKDLSKLWQHCDRQLSILEAKLKPPPIEASFADEPDDDGTEALGAPERQPGEDPGEP